MVNKEDFANRDCWAGILVILIGLAVAIESVRYEIGSLRRMGPGFFPFVLGVLMVVCGIIIWWQGLSNSARCTLGAVAQIRGWVCIVGSLVVFIVAGKWSGLVPATFLMTLVAAMGDRENTFTGALVMSTAMTLVAIIVFWWLLQIQFPLFEGLSG